MNGKIIPLIMLSVITTNLIADKIKIPLPKSVLSTENSGTKSAIDAYQDGVGLYTIESLGAEKIDNSEMNTLVFSHGEAAKELNVSIKEYVQTSGTDEEKILASTVGKFEPIIPDDGTVCNDANVQTINDKYVNGVCVGTNVQGLVCNDNNAFTINDKYNNGVCAGDIGVETIREALNWTTAPIGAKAYDLQGIEFSHLGNGVWGNSNTVGSSGEIYVASADKMSYLSNNNTSLKVYTLQPSANNTVQPVADANGYYNYVSTKNYPSISNIMLNTYGFAPQFTLGNSKALLFDTTTAMQSNLTSYTPPTIAQMFNDWHRTANTSFYENRATTSNAEAQNWSIITSSGQQSFSNATNTGATIAVISNIYYNTYNFGVTVGSTAADNDEIGVVGAFYKDGSNWEYLMASVRRDTGLFYIKKYSNAGVSTLYTSTYSTGNWPGYQTKFKVTKTDTSLKFEATPVNSSTFSYSYTFNLNEAAYAKYKNATGYGFVEQSQANTFYINYSFTPTSVSNSGSMNEAYSLDGSYAKYTTGWAYSSTGMQMLKTNYLPGTILNNPNTGLNYLLEYNNGTTYKVTKVQ